ncbi:MAG: response regulator transcription factor [Bacteroidia bacterium]|nr:response regulator transcription factor [Bacteroidia bacterium]MCF8427248.1 response regulator transcription factor [Bacteroidia bacterium]MCF8445992.1 response regulator transcription factor [Bacteroidia bacterium]
MKLLVVEDEPKVASFLKQGLEEQNNEVTVVYDGYFARKMASENAYDAIVLDVMIPYLNGLEVSRELRAEGVKTPILMLTALGSLDEKVNGLDAGADDYLVKPFEFKELLARLRALTKRYTDNLADQKILKLEDLELDLNRKVARRGGKTIDLTAKEFSLLEYLIRNKNRVISRTEILEKVWEAGFDTTTNVIDVYINFLRKKIDKDFPTKIIHTMVGMGYIIKSEA